ncbi:MAG TPA: hypothetical protein V6D17_10155 [Candidatus Obscuribacterales bacterium]
MTNEYEDLSVIETIDSEEMEKVVGGRRGRGADDPAGDVRGRRRGSGGGGQDDGLNHT